MAARLNPRHQDEVRLKIKSSQLINRLTDHVLGNVDMKPSQVTAALGLLKKCVADLTSVEHSGEVTQTHYVAEIPRAADTVEEWTRLNGSLSGDPSPALKTH
jgi:hypothetical protein